MNVRLPAVRKLVEEAQAERALGVDEAARSPASQCPAAGNAQGQLAHQRTGKGTAHRFDRSTLKGKRDYAILALLVGCALRRAELASLDVETIQQREGRWVLADLVGKGGRVRTVAVPVWVKHAINAWQTAAASRTAGCSGASARAARSARD